MGGNETMMEKRFTLNYEINNYEDFMVKDNQKEKVLYDEDIEKLLNDQDQRIKELEEQLKLVCEADCVTPHDSVKEILRDEIKGIDTVAGESAMAWHDYCVLDKVFKEQYDNELWDNYDD